MGTVSSASKDFTKKNDSQNTSSEYEIKQFNSIKDINNINSYQGQSETTENTKITDKNEQLILYPFEWKEGGNEVLIYGSFAENWNKKTVMKKDLNTGIFQAFIEVPRGRHEFKFVVDQKWVCSQYYDRVTNKNNITNNVIDLTNYIPPQVINSNNISNKKKRKSTKNTIDYGCNYPKKSEVNLEAPILPQNFFPSFNLDIQSKQEFLQKVYLKDISFDKTKTLLENNTFKSILTISHEKLLHICHNVENNYDNDNDNKYIRTALTQRNKHKFLTLVYYTPKK